MSAGEMISYLFFFAFPSSFFFFAGDAPYDPLAALMAPPPRATSYGSYSQFPTAGGHPGPGGAWGRAPHVHRRSDPLRSPSSTRGGGVLESKAVTHAFYS